MTDFETILCCFLVPVVYVLTYIAGKYGILAQLCQILEKEKGGYEMKWFVYQNAWNERNIVKANIFNHYGFSEDVKQALRQYQNKEDFAKALRSSLQYHFWAKCEHEIFMSSCPDSDHIKPVKVDIYDQVTSNWDAFLDYVWKEAK